MSADPAALSRAMSRLPWADTALRPVERADLDRLHAWQNDAELRDVTMGYRFPIQRERVGEWIDGLGGSGPTPDRAIFSVWWRDAHVGTIRLYGIDYLSRTALIGTTVVPSEGHPAGIGQAAMLLLVDYGFNGLNLGRLEAETLASNRRASNLFERSGFTLEGRRRRSIFSAGRMQDTVIYGLLREEFSMDLPAEARLLRGRS